MTGRHHSDLPEEPRGDDGIDPSRPVFGPANDGSADWFAPRPQQAPQAGPGGPPGDPAAGAAPGASAGGAETPDWFTPRRSGEQPVFGAGGFGGASDAGGYGLGRSSASSDTYGFPAPEPQAGSGGGHASPTGAQPPAAAPGYGRYESIRSSDGGPTGYPGGGSGSGGYGSSGSGGYGSSGSGGYASGGYGGSGSGGHASSGPSGPGGPSPGGPGAPGGGSGGDSGGGSGGYGGEYDGRRRKKRRSAGALIGPMAGAVGLALLLGVGVYAFAEISGGCDDGDALVLDVAVSADIQPAVVKAAQRFNDARHKVDGKCAQARVAKAEPSSVTPLLSGQAVPTATNRRPDVWIPDTSLWTSLVRSSDKGKDAVPATAGTSLASSPVVVGMPRTLATKLRRQGITANPSWDNLLNAAGGTPGGAVTKNQVIPAGTVRLLVPDPTRNGAGMGALMVTSTLLTNDPNRDSIFTGIVRTVRESMVPTVQAQFTRFRKGGTGRQPISLSSEQALYAFNRTGPAEPAVAMYPVEGTLSLDYPFTVVTGDAAERKAARLLERELTGAESRKEMQALGFRTPDGKAPAGFGSSVGTSTARPRKLPTPKDSEVARVMQAWSKLTLGLRILTVIDVSGSMAEKVGDNTTRLQAVAQLSQGGLSMMSDDTELGTWVFSTNLNGKQDWREIVSLGPLGERVGSSTRRNLVLSNLGRIQPRGDTGLYDTVLAAYKMMNETYKPEFGNSILLLTDGKNDDSDGPTLKQTLSRLKSMIDPNKPIQVNMIGFGPGTDRNELEQIASLTNGDVEVAQTPQEISKIFLKMLSRRISD
ncbi:substrate-binding domain-containing protein [Actinomadura keratinilytica]|uniref:VWFA domain-containing protein n=1 Tax=Actinomadura keratinilytica TaxID=547461 RepID=A0ABP7ZAJ8_9ACTN